jgi:signal transduction histidine kinase
MSPMSRRTWSIRGWLGIIVAAVAVPLLLLVLALFVAQVRRERAEARDAALRLARATADRIRVQHESSAALLRQMALRPAIRDFDGRTCDSLFAVVDVFPQWTDLLLYDGSGTVVCSAHPAGEDAALSLAAQQSIVGEIRAGALRTRRPQVRLIRGHWFSIVTQPVVHGDGTGRNLLVVLQVLDFTPPETLLPHPVITILDRDGVVLARSQGAESVVGRKAGNSEVARIALTETEGAAEARGLDGVSRQYGFTTLAPLGWIIYAGVPTEDIMRPVRQTFFLGIVGSIAILLLITFVAILLSRGIEKPVSALVKAAEGAARVGYGRAEAVGGPLEIARLSAAFNEMIERRSAAELRTQESERNLRALSERLINVQENERMRVAREIHDDLGQALTALKMDVIGLLEKTAHPAEAAPMVERILRTIDSTVTAVQRIASELRPSVLDDLGLFAAIESEARVFEERSGIECELSVPDEPPDVDKAAATAIYRIVQEALTNVARHSNASRVEIRVRERADELLLEIRDDGRGIASGDVFDPESLGLAGIRERADMLGGTARIEGVPGRGTIVSIRMPLAAPGGREA